MDKAQLIEHIVGQAGIARGAAVRSVKAFVGAIQSTIKNGGKITISGLGTFRAKPRRGRMGRNPKTGAEVPIPPGKKVSFKPSLKLRRCLK